MLVQSTPKAMNGLEKAKKQHAVHEFTLKTYWENQPIDGVGTLIEVAGRASFDEDAFLASLKSSDKTQCVQNQETVRVATPNWKINSGKLGNTGRTLGSHSFHSKVCCSENYTLDTGWYTRDTKNSNQEANINPGLILAVQSKNEWKITQLKTEILVSLGPDKEIKDVVTCT